MQKMEDEIIVDNQEELNIDNQEEENIYPMREINVEKGFFTVFELKRKYDSADKRIILDSDFQREDVWSREQESELVESVLMGLPLPIFYFNQDKYGKLIVVDGRQRLTALFEYLDDLYPLTKLKVLPNENKKVFSELSPLLQGRIEDYQIQAHVISPPTPDRLKFDIFDRVNRGGTKLNKQEIRNALYQGYATKMLNTIVKSDEFFKATGGAFKKEKRMKDKYLITRFLAVYLLRNDLLQSDNGNRYQYKGDIDELLGKSMDYLNYSSLVQANRFEKLILNTLSKSYFYLGEDAFRLMKNDRKTPINMNVFETIMYCLTYVPDYNLSIKQELSLEVNTLINSTVFRDNIGNHRDSESKLDNRLNMAEMIGRKFQGND